MLREKLGRDIPRSVMRRAVADGFAAYRAHMDKVRAEGARALAYAVAFADEREIDELNILHAAMLAMRRAVDALSIRPELALVDGNRDPGPGIPVETIVKGDALSASIAAASILAKVERDRFMLQMADVYPEYQFARHKGYPTALHYELLAKYGPCPIHRRSFRLEPRG